MTGGAAHAHALHHEADSPLHGLAPECKVAATLVFVLAVVSAPREAFWAYGCFALVVAGSAVLGQVPPGSFLRRLAIEVPFVAFAVLLPFVGRGERIDVGGLALSSEGLWGAWNILVKGTLGVAATTVLVATTSVASILKGLERLHVPRVFTAVCGFMVRYIDVIAGDMQRMRIARISRGYDPRWLWQARAVATSAGALFVRSFERGERVHLAMVARGFDGSFPALDDARAPARVWLRALTPAALAVAICVIAWTRQ